MKSRILILVIFVFLQVSSVFAHGDEARIELNVTQASPGATIDVRGTSFAPLETVAFTLVKSGVQVQIGDFEADIDGDFAFGLLLPFDLKFGEYELRAADTHHSASVPLSIVPDRSGEEEGEQRDEEESLLAPMPTFPPAAPVVATVSAVSAPAKELSAYSGLSTNILVLAGLMVVIAVLVFGFMRKRE